MKKNETRIDRKRRYRRKSQLRVDVITRKKTGRQVATVPRTNRIWRTHEGEKGNVADSVYVVNHGRRCRASPRKYVFFLSFVSSVNPSLVDVLIKRNASFF